MTSSRMTSHEEILRDDFGAHRNFSSFKKSTLSTKKHRKFTCCNKLPLLHPYGPFRYAVDFVIIIALIYTCIEVPITLSFNIKLQLNSTAGIIALCIDILLLLDVIINLRTAYFDKYDRLRLIISEYEIAKKYMTSWFIIDIISSFPFQLIGNDDNFMFFELLRSLKILRFIKMIKMVNKFTKTMVSREVKSFIKLIKLLLFMLLFAHFAACLWYFIGYHHTGNNGTDETWLDDQGLRDSNYSTFKLYSYAWYWAVVTLFTTGYGDITATNTLEQWVSSVLILIGTCFFSYFVGTLTVLITEGDKVKSYKLEKLEEAQHFCDQKNLPKEMSRAILTHTRYHCKNNFVFDENEIINNLPLHLKVQINYHLSQRIVKQIDIFQSLTDAILGEIALKIKSISCNENHILYHKGSRSKEIYIQRTGRSEIDYHDKFHIAKNKKILQRGDVFGLDAFMSPKRKTTVTCKTWSEFYVISITDIINVLQENYPKTYLTKFKKIRNIVYASKIDQRIDLDKIHYINNYDDDTVHADTVSNGLHDFLAASSIVTCGRYVQKDTTHTNHSISTNSTRSKLQNPTFSFFNRNNSRLRDIAVSDYPHHKKQKHKTDENGTGDVELKEKPFLDISKDQHGVSNSLYGHHAFYMQHDDNDDDALLYDSDNDVGDILPGLEYGHHVQPNITDHPRTDLDKTSNYSKQSKKGTKSIMGMKGMGKRRKNLLNKKISRLNLKRLAPQNINNAPELNREYVNDKLEQNVDDLLMNALNTNKIKDSSNELDEDIEDGSHSMRMLHDDDDNDNDDNDDFVNDAMDILNNLRESTTSTQHNGNISISNSQHGVVVANSPLSAVDSLPVNHGAHSMTPQ